MVSIRLMTPADRHIALRLTEQAGWNQTESDWRCFGEKEPSGCFVATWDNRSVGFTVTCVFGSLAWIAMVLVDPQYRRRGVATELLKRALAFLESQGVETVRLDATEAGERVYDPLGFVTEFRVTRYAGAAPALRTHPQVLDAHSDRLPELAALDARVAGADRTPYLRRLFAESPHGTRVCYEHEHLVGFVMSRPGAHALQVGPCIAHPQAGPRLLEDMIDRCQGQRIYVDVPSDHAQAVGVVEALGLTAQRHFVRMYRGRRPSGDRTWLWSSSGPEKG